MVKSTRYKFELKDKDKPRVNPKYAAHYTLSWIAYMDDMCNIYRAPKDKNQKYLVRIYWALEEK